MIFLLKCIWFVLPAYAANIFASLSPKFGLKKLSFPLDFGKKFMGKPLLGKNKTFRGFIFGLIAALFISFLQHLLYKNNFFFKISIFDYSKNFLLLGFLLGFGAMFGDAFGAFIKRRLGIPPGGKCLVIDQLPFIIFSLIFASFLYKITFEMWTVTLIVTFFLHILSNQIAFYLKIKKVKW